MNNPENQKYNGIRMFISSTFSDMTSERQHFNDIIVPKLRALCRDKGVSFFSVDLRWGVTEEDIENDRLVSLCLEEVDRCRPFFLGIIGNRYGSRMTQVSPALAEQYPWLADSLGASYTELEILYNLSKNDGHKNSLFLFKNCTEPPSAEDTHSIAQLKEKILKTAKDEVAEYSEISEFEYIIVSRFSTWLDEIYGDTDVHLEREKLFSHSISLHFDCNEKEVKSISSCIRMTDSTLILHGNGPLGKTSLLNRVAAEFPARIVINCRADESNTEWHYVAFSIVKKLMEHPDVTVYDYSWFEENSHLWDSGRILTDIEEEALNQNFVNLIKELHCRQETLLVINDIEYIHGSRTKYLQWIPPVTGNKFRIVCSSNDADIINSAEIMGWQCLEMRQMEISSARHILESELKKYGKNSKDVLPLLDSDLAGYPGYLISAIDFLNCFGSFDTVGEISKKLSECSTFTEYYDLVFDYIKSTHGKEFFDLLLTVLAAVSISVLPLEESGRFFVLTDLTSCDKFQWTAVSRLMSALRFETIGGVLPTALRDHVLQVVLQSKKDEINISLGRYFLSVSDYKKIGTDARDLRLQKNALIHFVAGRDENSVSAVLGNTDVMMNLCAYEKDAVRAALAFLMLETNRNVSKIIADNMEFLDRNHSGLPVQAKDAFCNLDAIYMDLSLQKEIDRINQVIDSAAQNKFVPFLEIERVGKEMFLGEEITIAAEENGTEYALNLLEKYRSMEDDTPLNRAMFANLRSELLWKHRQVGSMADFEDSIRLSTEAGSISFILFAYKRKIDLLIREKEYGEAVNLSSKCEKWSRDLGYVFFTLSFSNSIAVCLYRTGNIDESLEISKKYYDICKKHGITQHAFTFQRGIANALNIGGKYKECIKFCEDFLKNKNIEFYQEVAIVDVLKGAYCNDNRPEKAIPLLTKMVEDPRLDGSKRMLFSCTLASILIARQGFSKKAEVLLNDTFSIAQNNRNFRLIHFLLNRLYKDLWISKDGIRFWNRWKTTPGYNEFLTDSASFDDEQFSNGADFFAVNNLSVAKANVQKLKSDYRIAFERKKYAESAEIAYRLAILTAENESKESIGMIVDALESARLSNDPKMFREYLTYGIKRLMHCGKPTDEELANLLDLYLDPQCKAFLKNWEKAGEYLEDIDSEPMNCLVSIITAKDVPNELKLICLADLSTLIIGCLSPAELNDLIDIASQEGLESNYLNTLFASKTVQVFEKHDAVYGEDSVNIMKKTEKRFLSFISSSGRFEIVGGFGRQENPIDPNMVSESFTVEPKCDYDHLGRVLATVGVAESASNEKIDLWCITDIVFSTLTPELMQQVWELIGNTPLPQYQGKDFCHVNIQPNEMLRCMGMISLNSKLELPMVYRLYSDLAIDLIQKADALAKNLDG